MNELVYDLYAHQAWADAEHWRALEAHPKALDDATIRERLNHIHLTQKAFFTIIRRLPLDRTMFREETDLCVLKSNMQKLHEEAVPFVAGLTNEQLSEQLIIPWFKEPPLNITVAQALVQAAMHSQYHRAQNASHLRELGGRPTLTDFIAWLWKGRPMPEWT